MKQKQPRLHICGRVTFAAPKQKNGWLIVARCTCDKEYQASGRSMANLNWPGLKQKFRDFWDEHATAAVCEGKFDERWEKVVMKAKDQALEPQTEQHVIDGLWFDIKPITGGGGVVLECACGWRHQQQIILFFADHCYEQLILHRSTKHSKAYMPKRQFYSVWRRRVCGVRSEAAKSQERDGAQRSLKGDDVEALKRDFDADMGRLSNALEEARARIAELERHLADAQEEFGKEKYLREGYQKMARKYHAISESGVAKLPDYTHPKKRSRVVIQDQWPDWWLEDA